MDEKPYSVEIELLKDTLNDLRGQNKFIKNIVKSLLAIIALFILVIASIFVYGNERFIKFVLDYDVAITNTITTDNSSQNDGSISVDRK